MRLRWSSGWLRHRFAYLLPWIRATSWASSSVQPVPPAMDHALTGGHLKKANTFGYTPQHGVGQSKREQYGIN